MSFIKNIFLVIVSIVTFGSVHQHAATPVPVLNGASVSLITELPKNTVTKAESSKSTATPKVTPPKTLPQSTATPQIIYIPQPTIVYVPQPTIVFIPSTPTPMLLPTPSPKPTPEIHSYTINAWTHDYPMAVYFEIVDEAGKPQKILTDVETDYPGMPSHFELFSRRFEAPMNFTICKFFPGDIDPNQYRSGCQYDPTKSSDPIWGYPDAGTYHFKFSVPGLIDQKDLTVVLTR